MLPPTTNAPPAWTVDEADPTHLRLSGRWTLRYAEEMADHLRRVPGEARVFDARGVDRQRGGGGGLRLGLHG